MFPIKTTTAAAWQQMSKNITIGNVVNNNNNNNNQRSYLINNQISNVDFNLSLNFNNDRNCNSYAEVVRIVYNDWTGFTSVRILFAIFYSVIFCTGVVGNGCVLTSILRYPQLRTVRNLFIFNLSFSDLLVTLFSLPVTAHYVMYKDWILGKYACYIVQVLQGMSINISTFTLTMIAIDRYILIVHPTRKPIYRIQAILSIVSIWALAALVVVPVAIHIMYLPATVAVIKSSATSQQNQQQKQQQQPNQQQQQSEYRFCEYICREYWIDNDDARKAYGICLLLIQYLIPLFLIASCYIRIAYRLKRRLRVRTFYVIRGKRPRKDLLALQRQCRTNRMLILMVALYGLVAAPNTFVLLMIDFNVPITMRHQFYFIGMCTHTIWMTSVIWNPILYGFLNETFQIVFLDFLPFTHKSLERMAMLRQQQLMMTATHGYSLTADMLRKLSMSLSLRNTLSLDQQSLNAFDIRGF